MLKKLIKRKQGRIWRAILIVPVSLMLIAINFLVYYLMLIPIDKIAKVVLKNWLTLREHISTSPNFLTQFAWFVLYLPFIILSLLAFFLVLYPAWFVVDPLYKKMTAANMDMVLWIEYRKAKPGEYVLTDDMIEKIKRELRRQGISEKSIQSMLDANNS